MTIVIRDAETDADLEAWRQVRLAVLPNERALPVDEMRAMATPETRYVIAELDGELAGSGLGGRSSFDYAGIHPRVLPGVAGAGSAPPCSGARRPRDATGFTEAGTLVDDEGSMAFAERFGFREVDRQIEQVAGDRDRAHADHPRRHRVVTVAERPELWPAGLRPARPGGARGHGDRSPDRRLARTVGTGLAVLAGGDVHRAVGDEIVGWAGLELDADQPDRAEHAFTAVARPLATPRDRVALKRLTLAFAADERLHEVYTWTQIDNADMRALNKRLGYVYGAASITVRGPLPLAGRPEPTAFAPHGSTRHQEPWIGRPLPRGGNPRTGSPWDGKIGRGTAAGGRQVPPHGNLVGWAGPTTDEGAHFAVDSAVGAHRAPIPAPSSGRAPEPTKEPDDPMGVPKRRVSHARQGERRAHLAIACRSSKSARTATR